ncbi:MAG: NosD domain-containing protein [Chloroflexota bacterium]|nr:NosD domain-containing protein [Chloroflexota bacterium]
MKRLTINTIIPLALGCGLTLALLWLLGGPPVTDVLVISEAKGPERQPLWASDNIITVCLSGGCDYDTIQAAVDAASDGDEIRVAGGNYTDIHQRAGITQVVYISKTVTIRGGYTVTDWEAFNPDANPTILDAEGQGRVLYITGEISPTIEGLHITGGNAAGLGGGLGTTTDAGGGVYINAAAATISDCQVFSSTADWGGGLYLYQSDAVLNRNIVTTNTADYGGGLYLALSAASLSDNEVADNQAPTSGGGLYLLYGAPTLIGNTVISSTADWGGGLYLYQSDATLSGNTVTTNTAKWLGGGIRVALGAPMLTGNTVTTNTATYGGGLYLEESEATLEGNTVSGNTAAYGGGVYLRHSGAAFSGNMILSNTADSLGGGLCLHESEATLNGNTVAANTANYGGGLYLQESDASLSGNTLSANTANYGGGLCLVGNEPTLTNTVVADNQAHESGSGLIMWDGWPQLLHTTLARNTDGDGSGIYVASGSIALTNTILVSHTVGVCVASGTTATLESTLWWANDDNWDGEGTINHSGNHTGDPAFVAPDTDNYHIQWASAAIDAGVDAGVTMDIDGQPRPIPLGGGFDLGADEWTRPDFSSSRKTVSPEQADVGNVLTYTAVLLNSGFPSSTNFHSSSPSFTSTLFFDAIPTHHLHLGQCPGDVGGPHRRERNPLDGHRHAHSGGHYHLPRHRQ